MNQLIQINDGIENYFLISQIINKEKIISFTFNNFMDSCYIEGEMVMHDVPPIQCISFGKSAILNMPILNCELWN